MPRLDNENHQTTRAKGDARSPFRKLFFDNVKGDSERIDDPCKKKLGVKNVAYSDTDEDKENINNDVATKTGEYESDDGNETSSNGPGTKTGEDDDSRSRKKSAHGNETSSEGLGTKTGEENPAEKENESEDRELTDQNGTLSSTHGCNLKSISRKKNSSLPGLLDGLLYSSFSEIDANLSSGVLTHARNINEDSEVRFPFSHSCVICEEDRMSLRKNPSECEDRVLYAGTTILDVATQWTFMNGELGYSEQRDWCPLPAITFWHMTRGDYKAESDLATIVSLNPDTRNLFEYKVIDLVIHHGAHFSRVFIMNAGVVAKGDHVFGGDDDDDPCPCILHVDSLPTDDSSSFHETQKCAARVRKFLNQYGKEKHGYKNLFNKNSFPAYKLKVPFQEDGWSCGYHSLYSRFCLMRLIELNGNIFNSNTSSAEQLELLERNYFSYEDEDVMELRSDILYLSECLQKIKDYSKDEAESINLERESVLSNVDTIDLTNDEDELPLQLQNMTLRMTQDTKKKRKKESHQKKSEKKLSVRRKREMARQDLIERRKKEERLGKFHGKMNRSKNPAFSKAKARARLPPQRMKGEKASCLRSYKDRAFRRALYRHIDSLNNAQEMTNYVQHVTNEKLEKTRFLTFIIDPVGEYPEREGNEWCPFRPSPLRLALTGDAASFEAFKKDFTANMDKFSFTATNCHQIDKLLVGADRPPLDEFIANKPRREELVQDKAINKAALGDTKRLDITPLMESKTKGVVESDEDELEEEDMAMLYECRPVV